MDKIIWIVLLGIIGLLIVLFFVFVPVGLWISSLAANVKISIFNMIGMRLRRVKPAKIVMPLIKARKAGLDLGVNQLEAHYLAGGNVDNVVNALIASERAGIELEFEKAAAIDLAGLDLGVNQLEAHYLAGGNVDNVVNALIASERAGIELEFEKAAAIDLAGRNVLEAVKMSVNPKVIETTNVSAVAKDGIELLVKARVTVRADLERLVGGAGEATVLARIGEGIVTTVGSAISHKEVLENPDDISKRVLGKGFLVGGAGEATVLARIGEGIVTTVGSAISHKEVLENPDDISKRVLGKGLDSGTAFEILSIDIADIDVGRNIGAQLQSLQAEADKNIAQAKAEERRAMAVAKEQEMRAYVVEAEAEVPKAMAYALREGKLGVMDYYEMQNIKADTVMRENIRSNGQEPVIME